MGQQALLKVWHVFERDVVEVPFGGRQQDGDLRGQRQRPVGGLAEHSPQPFAAPDLALRGLVDLGAKAGEAGHLLELG